MAKHGVLAQVDAHSHIAGIATFRYPGGETVKHPALRTWSAAMPNWVIFYSSVYWMAVLHHASQPTNQL